MKYHLIYSRLLLPQIQNEIIHSVITQNIYQILIKIWISFKVLNFLPVVADTFSITAKQVYLINYLWNLHQLERKKRDRERERVSMSTCIWLSKKLFHGSKQPKIVILESSYK